MSTTITETTLARQAYYRLLASSFERARRLLEEMQMYPDKYSPERRQETIAYLQQLQKEMNRLDESPSHSANI
ncbi:hypothetical protein [Thermoactinomyces mirandus]|uniref:Uncharacterized protein n=1 Tax=Thermoactinomyces mirandus TaxID=2756294 RepID=A0A7W1XR26_9BACL|nr:hypothetical protein [Thermoactinomyces mirandus]MBA4601679.1 hypothetical protein [Thermoactinomyces mirandus]